MPKCGKCGTEMIEEPKMKGASKCPKCNSIFITKEALDVLKSIFTVT